MASPPPQISISADSMDEPPSYDEARNRNLTAHNPSDVPSLHTPSIIDLPHRSSHDAAPPNFDVPDIMPTLSMLGPPTELFLDAAPYFLMLSCSGPTARISGSHQPSLRLIAEYFKKWGRLGPPRPGMPASVRGGGTNSDSTLSSLFLYLQSTRLDHHFLKSRSLALALVKEIMSMLRLLRREWARMRGSRRGWILIQR